MYSPLSLRLQFAAVPATPAFLLFQRSLYPKLEAASRSRAALDPSYVEAASLYNQLLNKLIRHSPRFAADALDSRLIYELLRAFPFAPRPFLAWAAVPDLKTVTDLAMYQASTLVCLQETNPRGPRDIRLKELDLVGDWLDRSLGFLDALWWPLLSSEEGPRFGAAAVHVLRFVDVVEGTREVNQALFTPVRRAAMLRAAERVCRLGISYEPFARQVVQTVDRAWVKMARVAAGKDSWDRDESARVSLTRAVAHFEKLRTARESTWATWHVELRDLHEEMQKGGLTAQDTQRLAARGMISLLVDILEQQDMTRERKPGLVSGTTEGPVWAALEMLAALSEPFDPEAPGADKAFCRELAEAVPRLVRFAGAGAVGALGSFELRLLLEALFTVVKMNPDERWALRWPLLDVLLATCKRFVPRDPGAWRIWDRITCHLSLIPDPTVETVRLITQLRATPSDHSEKREEWSKLMQKVRHEVTEGEATWGPDARERKLCHVALKVLDEGHAAMADVDR